MDDLPPEARRIADVANDNLKMLEEAVSSPVAKAIALVQPAASAALLAEIEAPFSKARAAVEAAIAESHEDMVSLPRRAVMRDDAALEEMIRRVVAEELDKRLGPPGAQ